MSIWFALFWGAVSSAALFIGQLLARPLEPHVKATGLLMGFGAGTMLSAVAYELIPLPEAGNGGGVAIGILLGALTYYVGDRLVDERGGKQRAAIPAETGYTGPVDAGDGAAAPAAAAVDAGVAARVQAPGAAAVDAEADSDGLASHGDNDTEATDGGSGAAMFLGALLDGIPEAFILGIGIALGGGVSVAFVAAVFISNVPQGAAGTLSLRQAGTSDRTITAMWGALTLASATMAGVGYLVGDTIPNGGITAQAFAGGAVLVMLADSMMPEAFEHGGRSVGLLTVLGYLAAAILTVAD